MRRKSNLILSIASLLGTILAWSLIVNPMLDLLALWVYLFLAIAVVIVLMLFPVKLKSIRRPQKNRGSAN